MNRASIPLLELATLSVVILGCVIAVVPGADSYVLHWFSPLPQSPTVDARLVAENVMPIEHATEHAKTNEPANYPERFASREPLPISASSQTLILDMTEQKLPKPDTRLIKKAIVKPSHDQLTIFNEEPTIEESSNQILDEMLDAPSEPLDFHGTYKQEIATTDSDEPPAPVQITAASGGAFSPESVPPVQSDDARSEGQDEHTRSKFAETIERFRAAHAVGKEAQTADQSVSWIRNTTLSQTPGPAGLIKNQFVEPSDQTERPGRNLPMIRRTNPDWDFEELPARQLGPPRSSKRLPMAAESMQRNNDFHSRTR